MSRSKTNNQNAWFVRAGAVLPMAEKGIRNLQDPSNALRLVVIPGKAPASVVHYEDDGISQRYVEEYALIRIEKRVSGGRTVLDISAREGTYAGAPATRRISVVLEGVTAPPSSVRLNGTPLGADAVATDAGKVEITLPESSVTQALHLEIL